MGSPEKPLDLEMGDMSDETKQLNPPVTTDQKPEKEDQPERFTGLKKEELLEISSQKKWVVTRWILFILFWVGWVGMLVGAIIIVINAPRCKSQPTPPWHQNTVVYELDIKKFSPEQSVAGVASHLDYLSSLNVRALSVSGLTAEGDFKPAADLSSLVEEAEKLKTPIKVVPRLRIDVLGTSSTQFNDSKNCKSGTSNNCDFFFWSNANLTSGTNYQWVNDPTRNSSYKADKNDKSLAFINFGNGNAKEYLKASLNEWLAQNVNGFHLSDFGNIEHAAEVVQLVRTTLNASDDNPLGLFLSTSDSSTTMISTLYGNQENDTFAPVVFNQAIAAIPLTARVGKAIQDSIMEFRSMNDNENKTNGYSVNPSTQSQTLVQKAGSQRMAGALQLLNLVLPGIPIIQSGDELGSEDGVLQWDGTKIQNATELMSAVADTVQSRVPGYAVLPSLAWDRVDQYANLTFHDAGTPDVLLFTRKWDTKPTALVVSNLSPSNHTIDLTDITKNAKVLSSSATDFKVDAKLDEDGLKKLDANSGLTLVLKF